MSEPIIIVGAGQAGLQLAESLRVEGWTGGVTLLGDEPHPPYQRPPLSKAFLTGDTTKDRLVLRGPEALAAKGIEHRANARVEAIDRAARAVRLTDGDVLSYHALALATGSRARALPIPGAALDGVLSLRGIDDGERILAGIEAAPRVVIVGGGFIGLEIAATARKRGCDVTILEAAPRLMARAVAPSLSAFYAALHEGHGARLLLGAGVLAILGENGRARAVATADGVEHPADLVIIGAGARPNDELAVAAGLACDNGVIVDACSRTSDPLIVAAGDCAVRRDADGALRRLESVQNAIEQAKSGAAALMGVEKPFVAAPWFWSDQFDVKLQMAGSSRGADNEVTRGEASAFSTFHFIGDRLVGVDSVNRAQDHMLARRLLDRGLSPTPEQIADPAFDLGAFVKAGVAR